MVWCLLPWPDMVHTALDGAMMMWDATSVLDAFYDAYHLGFIWI